MKVSDIVSDKIDRLQTGYVFTYSDFDIPVNKGDALIKVLNRMVKEGKICKLSKGRFYKPKETQFGELKPDTYQIVKDLLEKNGKVTGYITGYSAYNQLGLTTQVPNLIQIGVNKQRKSLQRGIYSIRFMLQNNKITKENITLLKILDAIKGIKEIPDTTVDKACKGLREIINDLEKNKLSDLKTLALNYNPSTRALLGAIIETVYDVNESESLYNSLNPSTNKYFLGISESVLPNKKRWNIR